MRPRTRSLPYTGVRSPSFTRFVQFAVAITMTNSMICSSERCRARSSRSLWSMFPGRLVRFGEAEHRALLIGEEVLSLASSRLLQSRDLVVREPSPLARSGMRSRSVLAAVLDRDPQVGELLRLCRY